VIRDNVIKRDDLCALRVPPGQKERRCLIFVQRKTLKKTDEPQLRCDYKF
jgi:hypothetical protein